MEKIHNLYHRKEAFSYSIAYGLSRASFFGLHGLSIMYMTGVLGMSHDDSSGIFAWVFTALIYAGFVGALLGDLFLGNKKAILLGGIMQAAGACALCLPNTAGLYTGLFLIGVGGGFFAPNLLSSLGRLYQDRKKLLDAGFTMSHLASSVGILVGGYLLGSIGITFGYQTGFILAGLLSLASLYPVYTSEAIPFGEAPAFKKSRSQRAYIITVVILLAGLFWGVYEISSSTIVNLQFEFATHPALDISFNVSSTLDNVFAIPLGLLAVILWTQFYQTQSVKLTLGFLSGALGLGLISYLSADSTPSVFGLFMLSMLLLNLADILISPMLYSVLAKYADPKFLATLLALSFAPRLFFATLLGFIQFRLFDLAAMSIHLGPVLMTIASIGLIGFLFWNRKSKVEEV